MSDPKSLKDLQEHWYKRLKSEGFTDIESVKHSTRPLKEWHNHKFCSERFIIIQASRSQYQRQIDEFINHPSFVDACSYTTNHGNCRFTQQQASKIWELYCQGLTRRKIANQLKKSRWTVDNVIKRLKEWMQLI